MAGALLLAALATAGCATILLPPPGTAERVERLIEQGRAADALQAAREVPRKSPDYGRAQQLAARAAALRARLTREALARGGELEEGGKLYEAVRAYEEGLVADPQHAGLLGRLAAAREALAAERERRRFAAERIESAARLDAERAWGAVAEVDPTDREVRRRLAELNAKRAAQAALHVERAQSLRESGRLRDAVEEAELAARLDPTREGARELVARLRAEEATAGPEGRPRQSGPAGARPEPRPAAKKEEVPTDTAEAIVREAIAVARAAARRKDFAQAQAALTRAETQARGAPELAAERASLERQLEAEVQERIKRGIAKFQLEDLEGAIDEWGRALDLDPGNTVALDYRRKAQGMLKRIEAIREENRQQGEKDTRSGSP